MTPIQHFKIIALSTFFVLTSACSHVTVEIPNKTTPVVKTEIPEVKKITPLKQANVTPNDHHQVIVEESLADYKKFVKKNQKTIASRAKKSYNKGYSYKGYIEKVAEKNNLPEEIFALAAIESDFNVKAKSISRASGMWQLMPSLGRQMGLTVNSKVDERNDWKKSTEAALKHLGKTKQRFDSEEIAILSYYSGVWKVNKAIEKNNSKNIWVLLNDSESFGKGERAYMYKYMAYAEEFKKLNAIDSKVVSN